MIEAFRGLHLIQREFDQAALELQASLGVSLCRNCGTCCSQNTPMWMTIEALNAVSVLAGRPVFRQAVSAAEGWLLDRGQLTVFDGVPTGTPSPRLVDEWETVTASPCPFRANGGCLVYEARPLTCRAWGTTREPASFCQRPPGLGETETYRRWVSDPRLPEVIRLYKKLISEENPSWTHYGQAPTLFYRSARESKFREMVKNRRIASAKLWGTGDVDLSLMWQPQVEMLKKGVSPELVASGRVGQVLSLSGSRGG